MTIYDYEKAKTPEECILRSGDIRVSVLSERIIRVERSKDGAFTDAPTQTVIDRSFAKPQFEASETADKMVVTTQSAKFIIDKRSLKTECALGGKRVKPSPRTNLGGTARTLDGTFGVVRMLKSGRGKDRFFFANVRGGVMSSNGVAELDDSRTLILGADGTVSPRKEGVTDKYIFAFGNDFAGGLKEYYALTGFTPILPKYALGNWW